MCSLQLSQVDPQTYWLGICHFPSENCLLLFSEALSGFLWTLNAAR